MNKREAVAVQALLDWMLALTLWEIDDPADHLADDELVRIVGVLADRSHAALGAGLRQDEAIAAAMRLLGWDDVRPVTTGQAAVDVVDLELPANAGSST